jgi:hypothetical protein
MWWQVGFDGLLSSPGPFANQHPYSNNIHGRNGRKIGWKPKYDVEHLYNTAEDETRFIVEHM